jgi:thymidylate kinase
MSMSTKLLTGIIFEGVDCAGKDTVIDELHKLTDKTIPVINRLWGSIYVYSKHRKRKKISYERVKAIDSVFCQLGFVIVYLTAEDDVLECRQKIKADDDIKNKKEFKEIKNLYNEYLNSVTNMPVICVDTTIDSPKSCAEYILRQLKGNGYISRIIKKERKKNEFKSYK